MKITDLKDYTVVSGPSTGIPGSKGLSEKQVKSFGQKVLDAGTSVANFVGAKGIQEKIGADFAKSSAKDTPTATAEQQRSFIEEPTVKERIGSVIQTGANFIPGAGKGLGLLAKTAIGAGTGLAFDAGSNLQNKSSITEALTPGVGTAVGGALPVAGAVIKPVAKIVGRLFKGLGSGLSGVSTDTIEKIVSNPETAQKVSDRLAKSGNNKILEENTKKIVNGVSTIKREASDAFSKGLDELSEVDIVPENIRTGVVGALEKNGISVADNGISFSGADFLDNNVQKKAENVINLINNTKDLSGTGVRKLIDIVDNAKFKSAPDGERQAFNALMNDMKAGLREGVSKSTSKLDEINAKYSQDLQLAETVEDIFGNVQYKNLPELVKASKKLETLFAQKGLAPEVVDDFLTRIGENADDFKTSEAVRQISNKSTGANTTGLSVGELVQQATSSVVTPKMVKNISIYTGLAEQKVIPFLRQLSKPARNTVIQALIQASQSDSK